MAAVKTFSTSEALHFGWEITKKNFWFVLVIFLIPNGVSFFISYITGAINEQGDPGLGLVGSILLLAGWIVGLELSFATIVILLKIADKKKAKIEDLIAYFQAGLIVRYFLVSLIYGLMVGIGLILFIVPGIYLGIKYGFAFFVFADKRTGVWEAFQKSAQITSGVKWKLFGFWILMLLITAVGAMALLVGLLIAVPVVYFAEIYVYRKLSAHHHS